jgi:hypothetical protein
MRTLKEIKKHAAQVSQARSASQSSAGFRRFPNRTIEPLVSEIIVEDEETGLVSRCRVDWASDAEPFPGSGWAY